jgi:hypothetical protein
LIPGYTPASEPERADAIVALTGPSAERVNAAIRLLEQDKGERVLISGVNREVRRQELRALTPGFEGPDAVPMFVAALLR